MRSTRGCGKRQEPSLTMRRWWALAKAVRKWEKIKFYKIYLGNCFLCKRGFRNFRLWKKQNDVTLTISEKWAERVSTGRAGSRWLGLTTFNHFNHCQHVCRYQKCSLPAKIWVESLSTMFTIVICKVFTSFWGFFSCSFSVVAPVGKPTSASNGKHPEIAI